VQLILVVIYILFEELIWEGIAKPVYAFVHSFQVLRKIEAVLHDMNAYVLLFVFSLLLAIVQILGLYAGILFVSGQVFLGFLFYLSKIPIAAFAFWVFRVTEDKLMQFKWFKWLYTTLMDAIAWLKNREIYLKAMQNFGALKKRLKNVMSRIKQKYFEKESPFIKTIKYLYHTVQTRLKK